MYRKRMWGLTEISVKPQQIFRWVVHTNLYPLPQSTWLATGGGLHAVKHAPPPPAPNYLT